MKKIIAFICTMAVLGTAVYIQPCDEIGNSAILSVSSAETNSEYAEDVIRLVNQEREAQGIAPLRTCPLLNELAEIRSNELIETFSHTRPDGSDGFDIIQEYGYSYRATGENIAYGQRSPEQVMESWLNSEGHRANILNSVYNYIGVGCVKENGSYYWTQIFYYIPQDLPEWYIPENPIVTSPPEIVTTPEPTTEDLSYSYISIVSLPNKLVYKIGEELDLTGGIACASYSDSEICADTFNQAFDSGYFTLNTSEFDNTKPGEYEIYLSAFEKTTSFTVTVIEPEILKGDITGNGLINVVDVTMLKQYLISESELNAEQTANADIIEDGIVDVKDLGQLIKYILKVVDTL